MKNLKIFLICLFTAGIFPKAMAQMPGTPYIPIATIAVPPGIITNLTCASQTRTGTLFSGSPASGATITVPYTGGNGGTYSAQSITSTVVTGLTATLTAGNLNTGAGNLVFTITGTPTSVGTANFALTFLTVTCTMTITVGTNGTPIANCALPSCYPWSYTSGGQTVVATITKDNGPDTGCVSHSKTGTSTFPGSAPTGCSANVQGFTTVPTSSTTTLSSPSALMTGMTSANLGQTYTTASSTYIITFSRPVNNVNIHLLANASWYNQQRDGTFNITAATSATGPYTAPALTYVSGCAYGINGANASTNGGFNRSMLSGAPGANSTKFGFYKIVGSSYYTQLKIVIPGAVHYIDVNGFGGTTGGAWDYITTFSALITTCSLSIQ